MLRKNHNEYIIHDDYAEGKVYNLKDEYVGSFIISIEDIEKCKKHRWFFKRSSKKII